MRLNVRYRISSTRDGLYAYGMRVTAHPVLDDSNDSSDSNDSNDLVPDPNIFVFRRSVPTMNPFGRTDGRVDDVFFNVATPVDMYDIPVGEPDPESGMPYFRDSELDLWFRNLEDAYRAKREIDEAVASLCRMCDNLSDVDSYESEEVKSYG